MALDKTKLAALFKKAQTAAKAAKAPVEGGQRRADERFLKLNIGSTYHLRLLFLPTKTRELPFIEQQVHRYYNKATREYARVVCPTSTHLMASAGFDACPVCKVMGDIWKRSQNGDKTAENLYKTFRRNAENYAVVYVVKDSSVDNPQTGKVKILKYGFEISKFLNAQCLGIAAKDQPEIDPDEIIGYEAFDLDAGRNLIIKVGKKDVRSGGSTITFPSYETSFSRSLSEVPLTLDDLPRVFKELRFDEEFMAPQDDEALLNFYKKYIANEISEAVDEEAVEEEEDVPYDDDEMPTPVAPKKSTKSASELLAEDDDFDDEEEEEEEEVVKPKKKAKPVVEEDDDDDFDFLDDDEEEEVVKPKKKVKKSSSDDIDDLLAEFDD